MASFTASESRPRSPRQLIKSFSAGDVRAHSKDRVVPNIPVLEMSPTQKAENRLLIVSNRLPITVKRNEEGKYTYNSSSGGLVSGMAGVMKTTECVWYGWVGLDVPAEDREEVRQRCWAEQHSIPVFISESLSEGHYNGFSNSILWPLFHYHPEGISFEDSIWNAYQDVNRIFAMAVAQDLKDNDIVWVQDYHLMLLPAMLREELSRNKDAQKNIKIGFFLHTPFPSSEIYRILPAREEILHGVLQSDLIGFHTIDYVRHFLNSCARVLHLATTPTGVHYKGRFVAVQDFPIGIDPSKFKQGLQQPIVKSRISNLKKRFDGVQVIVGIDRLDYIKGMQQKLHAFEVFLTEHPEWTGKVVLIQVAVPSRGDVEEYQNLRATVNELVGRINGKFSTVEFTPIHFLHQSVEFNDLIALYAVSDVCLVTSTRDGMNLVSFEYIACQEERHGVMILSEFAGAAQSLNGSLIVNPWDTDNVAEALHTAVTMSGEQRQNNYLKLKHRVNHYTSQWWGDSFISEIIRMVKSVDNLKVAVANGTRDLTISRSEESRRASPGPAEKMPAAHEESMMGKGPEPELEESYAELYEEDEGIMMKAAERMTPPPYAG